MSYETYFCSIIKKNGMLADLLSPRRSNDMTTAVQKNHLRGLIFVHSLDRFKNGVISLPSWRVTLNPRESRSHLEIFKNDIS